MSGSHYANAPEQHGAYFDAAPDSTHYDLRTVTEREADELAALRSDLDQLAETVRLKTGPVDVALEVDKLADALDYANGRIDALERRVKALEAASAAHADLLQVYRLREGL